MKNILLILILTFIISCNSNDKRLSNVGEILQGKHKLRRFKTVTKEGSSFSGGFFLLAGSVSGSTYKHTKASFSWQINTGEYAISEMELGSIRVMIDDKITEPYVTFSWEGAKHKDLDLIFKYYVNYMVIHCKEEDYPINIDFSKLQ